MNSRRIVIWVVVIAVGAVGPMSAFALLGSFRFWFERACYALLLLAAYLAAVVPSSRLLDRDRTQLAGAIAVLGLTVVMLLLQCAMWDLFGPWGWSASCAPIALCLLTAVVFCAVGLCAVVIAPLRWSGATLIIGGIATSVLMGFACVATWGSPWMTRWSPAMSWFALAMVLGGTTALLAGALALHRPAHRRWRWIGVVSAVVGGAATFAWIGNLWPTRRFGDNILAVGVLGLATAFPIALAGALAQLALPSNQRWLVVTAVGFATATSIAALPTFAIDPMGELGSDAYVGFHLSGLVAAGFALTTCAALAAVMAGWLARPPEMRSESRRLLSVEIVCPLCGVRGAIGCGASQCSGCGLRFKLDVQDPRCPTCDYLLLRIAGDKCPECGTPVSAVGQAVRRFG